MISGRDHRLLEEIERGLCAEDPGLARWFDSTCARLAQHRRAGQWGLNPAPSVSRAGGPRGAASRMWSEADGRRTWLSVVAVVVPLLLIIPAAVLASAVLLLVCIALVVAGLGMQVRASSRETRHRR
jgi:hypothetical protein